MQSEKRITKEIIQAATACYDISCVFNLKITHSGMNLYYPMEFMILLNRSQEILKNTSTNAVIEESAKRIISWQKEYFVRVPGWDPTFLDSRAG